MAIVKGTTKNGFEYEFDNDIFGDWEVMDWFTEILEIEDIPAESRSADQNMTLMRNMFGIIRRAFTRKQINAWKATNRDENGNVDDELMWGDFEEIFLSDEDADEEIKNS